jgi:hypothetical protein
MKETVECVQNNNARYLIISVFGVFFHVHESTNVLGTSIHAANEEHVWNTCPK